MEERLSANLFATSPLVSAKMLNLALRTLTATLVKIVWLVVFAELALLHLPIVLQTMLDLTRSNLFAPMESALTVLPTLVVLELMEPIVKRTDDA
jgi:hypothetical protein